MRKSINKVIAVALSGTMCLGLAACGSDTASTTAAADQTAAGTDAAETKASDETAAETGSESGSDGETPLVYGTNTLSQRFSPFFAQTAYDQDLVDLTQVSLLTTDRTGAPVYNSIEGETIAYNGTDYTYTGISDITVEQGDTTTTYDIKLRDDVLFSDGENLTADDVIFTMYVLSDPSYTGSATLYSTPIVGMANYRANSTAAGDVTADQIQAAIDAGSVDDQIQEIIASYLSADYDAAEEMIASDDSFKEAYGDAAGYLVAAYSTDESYTPAADKDQLVSDIAAQYGADYKTFATAYAGDETALDADVNAVAEQYVIDDMKSQGIGEEVPNIEGIKKINDYEIQVTTEGFDATMIYQLGIQIAPLHYYGDESKYDYENNQFGFDRGDLSGVQDKTATPMGAGPYKFVEYSNRIAYLEANENYYKGAPKTKYVQFKEVAYADMIPGIDNGTLDVAMPDGNKTNMEQIAGFNSNGETTGDKMTTNAVDFLGYGFVGINANTVNVGGDPASDQSKDLRKAIATVLAVYRDVSIDSYYGSAASVINYPISNTSWAAPQPSDADYQVAYSTDVNGNPIYTDDMSAEEKYDAAIQAALGFFEAAGYTVTDGKVTAAPAGASMEYEVMIPADGNGDHPSFAILTDASNALAEIGFTLRVNDLSDSNILWDANNAGTNQLWAAAWGATADPDMYQVYHSSNIAGQGGTDSNSYGIADSELDELIMQARQSSDQSFRKAAYKQCLDIILDWGVEIPVYQRKDITLVSTERVNTETLVKDMTPFYGWSAEIEKIEMN